MSPYVITDGLLRWLFQCRNQAVCSHFSATLPRNQKQHHLPATPRLMKLFEIWLDLTLRNCWDLCGIGTQMPSPPLWHREFCLQSSSCIPQMLSCKHLMMNWSRRSFLEAKSTRL